MNKIKVGFFSFSDLPEPGAYVKWHQTDHMAEQFRIAGLSWGQRFVATAACEKASATRSGAFVDARHLQNYLMEDPRRVLAEFEALGHELTGLGRMRTDISPCSMGAYHLLETHASPRVLLSPEAVPYRPNHGVYVIVETTSDLTTHAEWMQKQHVVGIPALLNLEGVVGIWSYASTGAYGIPRNELAVQVIYLDQDPVTVATTLEPLLADRWRNAPVEPLLAGPFLSYFPPPDSWVL